MNQNRNTSDEKRQEVLQRLRTRRGEARRTDLGQTEMNLEPDASVMQPLQSSQELQADVVEGADVSLQKSELAQDDKQIEEIENLRLLRQARRARRADKKQAKIQLEQNASQTSKLGQEEKLIENFLRLRQARRAKRAGRQQPQPEPEQNDLLLQTFLKGRRRNIESENISSDDFVGTMRQLLGSAETDLNLLPLEEIEQRRKDIKYRYDWMRAILEEMREELDKLQEHMIGRLQASTQSQEDSKQD
jgi:hypothetical protein